MSAYKKIVSVSLVDKTHLIQALEALGFNPIQHESPQQLEDFTGRLRPERADIVIPRTQINKAFTKSGSNDLGFSFNPDTQQYDMICSEYDDRHRIVARVKQAYAKIAIQSYAMKNRFAIKEGAENAVLRNRTQETVKIVAKKLV